MLCVFFFKQKTEYEVRISDWSSDVCSSDLPKSPHRRGCLAPRCRLITSWGWSRSQGFGCSPIKVVRELGLERRETVRSLSIVGVGMLRGAVPRTRGPGWTHLWCTGCDASRIAG